MEFIVSAILLATLTFAIFCLYCGVTALSTLIKKDGLRSAAELFVILYLLTAVVVIAVSKVSKVMFNSQETARTVNV